MRVARHLEIAMGITYIVPFRTCIKQDKRLKRGNANLDCFHSAFSSLKSLIVHVQVKLDFAAHLVMTFVIS